jgi:hypothetical protein
VFGTCWILFLDKSSSKALQNGLLVSVFGHFPTTNHRPVVEEVSASQYTFMTAVFLHVEV